jgi:hypothetical protein
VKTNIQTNLQRTASPAHRTHITKTTYLKPTTPPISMPISKHHALRETCTPAQNATTTTTPTHRHLSCRITRTHALTNHDLKQAQHKSTNPDKPTTHHAFANGRHCQPPHWNPTVSDNTARFSSGAHVFRISDRMVEAANDSTQDRTGRW